MKKLNVLLLGWDFVPVVPEEQETSCFFMANALAERVNLSVLLPQTDPTFTLPDVELTGLNQLDIEAIQTNRPQPEDLPYANQAYIRLNVPLYGSADQVNLPASDPGQAQSMGTKGVPVSKEVNTGKNPGAGKEQSNIFGYKDFENLGLDAQVIQFARYSTRWAAQRDFDVIYAYNYKTFLAGTELKLVTGKKLLLHVDSLSYERSHPNSKGWMFALEQLALQKGDYIFTNTYALAATLEKKYNITPDRILSLENSKPTATPMKASSDKETPPYLINGNFGLTVNTQEEESGKHNADPIWEVLQIMAAA